MVTEVSQELETVKEQLELHEARLQLEGYKRELKAVELAGQFVESWGQPIDPSERYYDAPGFNSGSGYMDWNKPGDRARGRNRPIFDTQEDLDEIRGISRFLLGFDTTSIGISRAYANYIVGTGNDYQVTARDEKDAGAVQVAQFCQNILDEFQEREHWRRKEREGFTRALRDGDAFFRVYDSGGGLATVRLIDPEYIREPLNNRTTAEFLDTDQAHDWSFGIATPEGDSALPLAYHLDWRGDGQDTEVVYAENIEHIKRGVDECVKRGVSDFYAAFKELVSISKTGERLGKAAEIQSCIAWIEEFAPGITGDQISSLSGGKLETTRTRTTPAGSSVTDRRRRYNPGTILRTEAGRKFASPPFASANSSFIDTLQWILRRVGVRWQMPEYMISGDASNANYSSTLVAESPFVKNAEHEQVQYGESMQSLMWKILRIAVPRMGQFVGSFAELRRLVKVTVNPPRVAVRNRNEEITGDKMLVDAGAMSVRTLAERNELDYEAEQAQGAAPVDASPVRSGPAQIVGNQAADEVPDNITATDTLNGAQITAAKDVLSDLSAGRTARVVAVELLIALGIEQSRAERMADEAEKIAGQPLRVDESVLEAASNAWREAYGGG